MAKGFAEQFTDRASAEKVLGKCHPAPLGNLRKVKKGGSFKDRVLLDLKWNRNNEMVVTPERVVLPRGIDHAIDLAEVSTNGGTTYTLVLDYSDAFHYIPLATAERRFCCCNIPGLGFLVFRGMGFGGRSFPYVFNCMCVGISHKDTTLLETRHI